MQQSDKPMVSIASYLEVLEAHMAKNQLQAEGIDAVVRQDHHIGSNWMLSNDAGGAQLQVPAQQVQLAKKILARFETGDLELVPKSADRVRCPKCFSADTRPLKRHWNITLFGLAGWNIPRPFRKNRYCCNHCGYLWKLPKSASG